MLTAQLLFANNQYAQIAGGYKNIWVAYSGGLDSHVLLHLAKSYFGNIRAIHINHALSKQDLLMQEHCVQTCQELAIELHCVTVDATPILGQSKEDAARNARRIAWQQVLQQQDVLLVAHHAEDQAETILYRLLRGAGPHGLTGMQACSRLGAITIVRPLLNTHKQAIIAYAKAHNLQWVEDGSNNDQGFDRNYIRKNIMPMLKQRWPAAISNINRAGLVCSQVLQFIKPAVADKLAVLVDVNDALDLKMLMAENNLWQQEILRAWLQSRSLTPSLKQLNIILREVITARADAMPQLAIGDKIIKRSKNKLYILDNNAQETVEYVLPWDLRETLSLPTGRLITVEQLSFTSEFIKNLSQYQVTVRQGILGRKAKKIFQQYSIPPWERANYPLIYADERLIAVLGLWFSNRPL